MDPPSLHGLAGQDSAHRMSPAPDDIVETIRRSRNGLPFILLSAPHDAAGRDALRSMAGCTVVRSIAGPATLPLGHSCQLHVVACGGRREERLAG
jgi:hypothetical protein